MPATFHRLGGFSGGVSLAEPLLPASSLTRNTRNTQEREREREESVFRVSCSVCWTVALALLFAGGVTTGDAYLFDRLGGFSGGVLLDEPLLPASSLTRNSRNS